MPYIKKIRHTDTQSTINTEMAQFEGKGIEIDYLEKYHAGLLDAKPFVVVKRAKKKVVTD